MITVYSTQQAADEHPITPYYLWINGADFIVYDGADIPLPKTPDRVTMAQGRLALLQQGDLAAVDAAVATLGSAAQINWEYQSVIHRNDPLVITITDLLHWSNEQVDALFTFAATL